MAINTGFNTIGTVGKIKSGTQNVIRVYQGLTQIFPVSYPSFGTGFNGIVRRTLMQPDGKPISVGDYTSYSGTTVNRIVKFNTDGTRDTTFTTGTGFSGAPLVMDIQPDGKIYVGGTFTQYNGVASGYLVRLNANGTRDTTFSTVSPNNFSSIVQGLAVQPSGKVLAGGNFATFAGLPYKGIVRLNTDSSIDTSFNVGAGINGTAIGFTTAPDGKIYVYGSFSTYNNVTYRNLVRLNDDGSIDTTFDIGVNGFGSTGTVTKVVIQPDGKLLIGGLFTSYKGVSANRIIRLDTNGTRDSTFNIGTGFDNTVSEINILPDNRIMIGGNFTTYKGLSANRIIKLDINGNRETSFDMGTGVTGNLATANVYSINLVDGNLLVTGAFDFYKGGAAPKVILLSQTGLKLN